MSKFYTAAILPALVAIGCIVAAWLIMHQPPPLIPPEKHGPVPNLPRHPTRLTAPTDPTPSSVVFLPSDRLNVPRPPSRTCIKVSEELQRGKRIWRLNFNSQCRDLRQWPTSSAWASSLTHIMRNVSSVALRSVACHASEYVVDVWNNTLDILFGGTLYSVTVPVGDYTAVTLPPGVQAAIIATDVALANFTVTYASLTDTVLISETTPAVFTLLWRTGPNANTSMWKTLGYTLNDITSSLGATHDAPAPARIDLIGVLAIDVFADELNNSVEGPIGRVQLARAVPDGPIFQNFTNETHAFWPIGRLTFLTFRFMVEFAKMSTDGTMVCDYRPYIFNGRNNTVRVDIGCTEYVNPMEKDVHLEPSAT